MVDLGSKCLIIKTVFLIKIPLHRKNFPAQRDFYLFTVDRTGGPACFHGKVFRN
jgi:hypothetical protein